MECHRTILSEAVRDSVTEEVTFGLTNREGVRTCQTGGISSAKAQRGKGTWEPISFLA